MFPKKLQKKIDNRKAHNALRTLKNESNLVDFSSNDYLGFAKNESIFDSAHNYLTGHNIKQNGATGSRLLSGNHNLYPVVENILANFHDSESALIFNSGYNANVGFFSAVPQKDDIILYDELSHASIRDGIALSHAKAYKFKHNNLEELEQLIRRHSELVSKSHSHIYIVTESVFSMDGDSPNLVKLSELCKKQNAYLVVDEAHAIGVFGNKGEGLVQHLKLETEVFARLVTFGKALGCHGAAILGSEQLKQYLINFSRSFIYTTGLAPHTLSTIQSAYSEITVTDQRRKLFQNIVYFKNGILNNKLQDVFIESHSAIHCCIISGNENVKYISKKLQGKGYDVKPILSPTVPEGQERLRFCLHSYNSEKEIVEVLALLATFVSS
ncbi:pyridoxal phosphate-dependent aminotransferase family protein [Seonamhaeicola sediminis]|uniref:Pyridoxal phosphate-dependent aminotransferase family protein n=1 Tax=Seonamhaeicola sediminis TaxID=2528206 RepID=A0A562YH47_9FLAO|nr:pyridoxal phosphate-dependent aminotransferase family protein [Seonamhaeicola sediminis]TWO33854.1 pyridoxal phosphate-dependent aminotransferase family protein [Seonamhaeicola sediminis]